ncbi:hypothetical protein E2C01_038684 [Portunus trituberculatus]|uniref:Endonuclease/exonuclease/phosphatase domain-containing protein n=1 Tax=Portunus trituberculatus TaxID=210409 RepID=A0A5B7FCV2_PORTR|nr:hypothetical protein [Portunus trituberculatus]
MATPTSASESPTGKRSIDLRRSSPLLYKTSSSFPHRKTVEHILCFYSFEEISNFGDFNVHHQLWLSSPFTDYPDELAFNFAVLHDLEQLVQHPTRILDHFGDTPNIVDLFITFNPSAYICCYPMFLGSSNYSLISVPCIISPEKSLLNNLAFRYQFLCTVPLDVAYTCVDDINCVISGVLCHVISRSSDVMQRISREIVSPLTRRNTPTKLLQLASHNPVAYQPGLPVHPPVH